MAVKEPPRLYTHEEVEEVRHQGYKVAEELYSSINNELKKRIKELENGS